MKSFNRIGIFNWSILIKFWSFNLISSTRRQWFFVRLYLLYIKKQIRSYKKLVTRNCNMLTLVWNCPREVKFHIKFYLSTAISYKREVGIQTNIWLRSLKRPTWKISGTRENPFRKLHPKNQHFNKIISYRKDTKLIRIIWALVL
jgi:hypothetical protein